MTQHDVHQINHRLRLNQVQFNQHSVKALESAGFEVFDIIDGRTGLTVPQIKFIGDKI
jgi:hypothetical protein